MNQQKPVYKLACIQMNYNQQIQSLMPKKMKKQDSDQEQQRYQLPGKKELLASSRQPGFSLIQFRKINPQLLDAICKGFGVDFKFMQEAMQQVDVDKSFKSIDMAKYQKERNALQELCKYTDPTIPLNSQQMKQVLKNIPNGQRIQLTPQFFQKYLKSYKEIKTKKIQKILQKKQKK